MGNNENLLARINKALGKEYKYRPLFGIIEDLLEVVEKQQNEYITLSQSISEDDAIIEQLQEEIKQYQLQETLLLERLKKDTLQIKEMKQNSRLMKFMEIAEENLALAQEVARLKGVLPV